MKIVILLLVVILTSWAGGSFYDLYAHNRTTNRPNHITSDFIASAYATYKISREGEVERKILQPRLINFANFLYLGVVNKIASHKRQALAYTAMLSLLAKNGSSLELPDGYENLQEIISKEAKLVFGAKRIAHSPIMKVQIDYRAFKVPKKYRDSPAYYRTLKYAQMMPFEITSNTAEIIHQTIQDSERLTNLYHYINKMLVTFVGAEDNKINPSLRLLPMRYTIDNYIFRKSPKPSIDDIAKVIYPNREIPSMYKNHPRHLREVSAKVKEHLIQLKSSYDYDMKIMQTLIKHHHISAFKGYYTQTKYRTNLYTKKCTTKAIPKEKRTKASIDPNLTETLSVMIEDALTFSSTIRNNKTDLKMITLLKKLREISQKSEISPLTPQEINFLNGLDLALLNIIKIKDRPLSVWIAHGIVERLDNPKVIQSPKGYWGGVYEHREEMLK